SVRGRDLRDAPAAPGQIPHPLAVAGVAGPRRRARGRRLLAPAAVSPGGVPQPDPSRPLRAGVLGLGLYAGAGLYLRAPRARPVVASRAELGRGRGRRVGEARPRGGRGLAGDPVAPDAGADRPGASARLPAPRPG